MDHVQIMFLCYIVKIVIRKFKSHKTFLPLILGIWTLYYFLYIKLLSQKNGITFEKVMPNNNNV